MEPRLEKRYQKLVKAHLQVGHELAAGVKSILGQELAFSQTQAAWRFLNNEKCTLEELSKPLLKAAHELSEQECEQYSLVAHDWSHLFYGGHKNKVDTYNTIKRSVGYELQTSLMLSDQHGGPLAPVAMNLKTQKEVLSSYGKKRENGTHLEELTQRIHWLESQGFQKTLVHIVDREGDAVAFFRALSDKKWLIRVNDNNYADDGFANRKIKEIGKVLTYKEARTVCYKGRLAYQQIGETEVVIHRKANPKRKGVNGKRVPAQQGEPVKARLVVSRVVDKTGRELAMWYLLSNQLDVSAATLALWYYWRWSIENYFKLMKSAGMQLESWQQTTGKAIARRLLVASMACICVWRIAHAQGAQAGELRKILVRLSGRQMKWKKEFSYPALLAGLWTMLTIDDFLANHDPTKIKSLLGGILEEHGFV